MSDIMLLEKVASVKNIEPVVGYPEIMIEFWDIESRDKALKILKKFAKKNGIKLDSNVYGNINPKIKQYEVNNERKRT